MKKPSEKTKKVIIAATAAVTAVAIGLGIFFGLRGQGEPVGVYPFSAVGMTEFWGDNQESYGPVTTDRIQTVFLSSTQTITEVLVKEGDKVKKGDALMTYDTTLSELQLERKRLDVEKANLKVQEAQEELARINKLEPMGSVDVSVPTVDTDWGEEMKGDYIIVTDPTFDGSIPQKAMVCWLKGDKPLNNALLRVLYMNAVDYQYKNAQRENSSASGIPTETTQPVTLPSEETTWPTEETTQPTTHPPEEPTEPTTQPPEESTQPTTQPPEEPTQPTIQPPAETTEPTGTEETVLEEYGIAVFGEDLPEKPIIYCTRWLENGDVLKVAKKQAVTLTFINKAKGNATWSLDVSPKEDAQLVGVPSGTGFVVYGFPEKICTETTYTITAREGNEETSFVFKLSVLETETEEKEEVNSFDIVLQTTKEDREKAPLTLWQGVHVTVYNGNEFGITLFDAPSPDFFFPEETGGGISYPDIDYGSGMTAAEIAKLCREQEKKIKELTAAAVITQSEYNLMLREFNDGSIRATLDGVVVSLLSEEEARQGKLPMMKVSGGGGFYVRGSVSELEKDKLKVGQEVTVNDWNTGMMYTGTVESIGDFPTQNEGWNGMGNPNASYYPFRVFIDGAADLQEGSYVSVTYSAAEAENGIYLENAFLRTDDGDPYVYVRGSSGKLEKRTVTTGKSLWGSYTEIRSGLTADDYVAFPYGKRVKPGAATQESDLSTLYGY